MEYYSFNQYAKDRFGQKVYKLSIDAGFTCPNRDGVLDNRGCIFCSGAGSGEFAGSRYKSISQQIEEGKQRVSRKIKNGKYIAYFQAFTNTYGTMEQLRSSYEEAIACEDIVGISIATRPDCFNEEIYDLLEELNRKTVVWVELGLQTIHEQSAIYIRRGYRLEVYDQTVKELKKRNIEVITHVILGLPGESKKEMLETVDYVGKSGVNGIKLQLLHVIKGTDLEKEYERHAFKTLEMDEYVSLVADCIAILPKNIVIHRITGDGAKKTLIAPLWSADKKRVLNALNKEIASR